MLCLTIIFNYDSNIVNYADYLQRLISSFILPVFEFAGLFLFLCFFGWFLLAFVFVLIFGVHRRIVR